MKTHKFNQDIEYWYDRSVKRWYCAYTDKAEREIIRLGVLYCDLDKNISHENKAVILAWCRELAENLSSRRLGSTS